MIALDTSTKVKKSPKKPLVQTPITKKSKESDSEEIEDSDAEEAGQESPNEEMECRDSVDEDDQSSSGAEGDESDASGEQSNDFDKSEGNPGWADAMRKILNTKKPKRKKTIVLSKAKKLNKVIAKPKEEALPFELEGENGEIKKETIKVEDSVETEAEIKKRKKKELLGIRVKPTVLDRERERRLQKIATNGVVQLFNAVKQQQQHIEDKLLEAGPLERKREKALKNINRRAFLDVLMGGTNNLTAEDDSQLPKKEEDEDGNEHDNGSSNKKDGKVWSVLRDDFVMGAKLKDWNKQDSSDEHSSAPEEMDSD